MILFCNLVYAYERKICEDKVGGCNKSFSWLGHKVNNKNDADCHHMAAMPMPMSPTWTCPLDVAASRQNTSTPFSF